MRTLTLLCAALLALLAAPAYANGGNWPKKPAPYRATGLFLADNVFTGFDGKNGTYTGAPGDKVDIVSNAGLKPLGWYLNGILTNGSIPGTNQALGYVAWSYGATVSAQVDARGHLLVKLGKRIIKEGQTLKLGKLVTIEYERPHRRRWWSGPRVVEITVRPTIKIAIIQHWILPTTPGARGSFAPYLEVKVVLTEPPVNQFTGYLGQTIVPVPK